MNVALFGGTFDPVHLGHVAVARAAAERFKLHCVYFVPAHVPPHKLAQPITAFGHRYAMVTLATIGDRRLVPSLLESPEHHAEHGVNYSLDSVRRFKRGLDKGDRLYFLIGIDAFLEIGAWHEPEALLREVEFIVVGRPGFSLAEVGAALPESLRPPAAAAESKRKPPATGDIVLPGAAIHLLKGVAEKVSATQIRDTAKDGRRLEKLVGPLVAEYIRKEELYRGEATGRSMKSASARRAASHFQLLPGGKTRSSRQV
jgi:nicotinate-nucleotide adenylyltransferase